MNYFVGLDVSLKRTAICVVDRDGNIVREGAADTEPETLVAWLKDTGLTFQRIARPIFLEELKPGTPLASESRASLTSRPAQESRPAYSRTGSYRR